MKSLFYILHMLAFGLGILAFGDNFFTSATLILVAVLFGALFFLADDK